MRRLTGHIDPVIFGVSAALYTALFLFIIIMPGPAGRAIKAALDYTFDSFGWLYLSGAAFLLVSLFLVAASRLGDLKLGQPGDEPEYSFVSWMGMLFGAGMGVGLLYFSVNEPMTHFLHAPFTESGTREAAQESLRLCFFHWGLHPWSFYCAAGLAMAYFQHRRGLPDRISSCLEPLLGRRRLNGTLAKVIDIFAIVATLCGVSTSAGFAASQFSAGLARQYGLTHSLGLVAAVIVVFGLLATLSAMRGVAKGIKVISDLNLWLVLALLVFIAVVGPFRHNLNMMLETLGLYADKFVASSLFLDAKGALAQKMGLNWVGSWTVSYFAWWLAFGPFVGGFLANISKGRTVRQFILACLFTPALVCVVWFSFYGGTALDWALADKLGLATAQAIAADSDTSLFIFLAQAPLPGLTSVVALALSLTLIVTSMNSGAYVLAVMSSGGDQAEPTMAVRGFWGAFMSINALLFLWVGGMQALRNSSMLAALPFLVIILLMMLCTIGALRQDLTPGREATPHLS